jgi:hypothetical protein
MQKGKLEAKKVLDEISLVKTQEGKNSIQK